MPLPRRCSICHHERSEEINRALVQGAALSEIAALFRVSEDALSRHRSKHLAATLLKAQEAKEVALTDDLLSEVRRLQTRTLAILEATEVSGEYRTALAAIAEVRRNVELLGKLAGELAARPVVNLRISNEWVQIRSAMIDALAPYPEARSAVAERLLELEGG